MFRNLEQEGAIQVDRYDNRLWSRMNEESERIATAREGEQGEILKDLWASLFKASPQLSFEAPLLNRRVMEILMKQSAWKDLRQSTQLDEYSAALGALGLKDQVTDLIPSDLKEASSQLQDLQQQAQRLLDESETREEAANLLTDEHLAEEMKELAQQLRNQAQTIQDQIGKEEQGFQQQFDSMESSIGRGFRHILEKTTEEMIELNQQMQVWGAGVGSGNPLGGKERMELATKIQYHPKLKELAKLAGRLQMIALNKRKNRTVHPPTEVVNGSLGNDLVYILPSELLLLANPETEDEFIRRYAESQLLQYDLKGFEREGQGPVVCCIDESGSTKGKVELWEKAIALSLFTIARREKRAFAVIHFGSSDEIKVNKWDNPHKDTKPSDLIGMAEHFFDGGTDFERPLEEAIIIMDTSDYRRGDIIFITDGEAKVSQDFLNRFQRIKKEKAFQVISVVIGYSDKFVRPFSDQIAKVQTVRDDYGDIALNFVIENMQ